MRVCACAACILLVSCGTLPFKYRDKGESLADLINRYRAFHRLPEVPLSPALTKVAIIHVRDLENHYVENDTCNLHSWSEYGEWTACCYADDHRRAQCMWDKPQEITEYPGAGYEIAASVYGAEMTPGRAMRIWRASPPHEDIMLSRKLWVKHPFRALGAAVSEHYAVAWFGELPDPASE